MIYLLQSTDTLPLLPANWTATYVYSRAAAYGLGKRFASFYADDKGNVLSIMDGNAVLAGDTPDPQEWAAFLELQPDIYTVLTVRETAQELTKYLQTTIVSHPVMRFCQSPVRISDYDTVSPTPRQMYPLLQSVYGNSMPPFDSWYVDISHRLRHNQCHVQGIMQETQLVSVAMTVAEASENVLIGAVATLPEYRRKGMASACLLALLADQPGKIVEIIAADDTSRKFYSYLGFAVVGYTGDLTLKKE